MVTRIRFLIRFFLLYLFLITSFRSWSQSTLSGRVTDGQSPLPSVNVLFLSADSSMVDGTVTDSTGVFVAHKLPHGQYRVAASMIGYKTYLSSLISVNQTDVTLPEIILEEDMVQMDELLIKESRHVIEQKVDRIVINLGGSITQSGNSMLEVLQKSPGVVVNKQNNTIGLNGRTGALIMINNKPLQVPVEVALQMLEGMSASNIEKLELITTPPSEFDAAGSAGVIHIVTKKDESMGTNGSVALTAGARWAEAFGGNFTLTHRKNRTAIFGDYSITTNRNLHHFETDTRSYYNGETHSVHGNSHRENFTVQQNLSTGLEWKINETSALNFLLTAYRRNWRLEANTKELKHSSTGLTTTQMDINETNIWQSAAMSAGLQKKINEKYSVSFSADYLLYDNHNPSDYLLLTTLENNDQVESSRIDLQKNTPINFWVGKADLIFRFSETFSLQTGLKAVTSTLENEVVTMRNEDDAWITDSLFTSSSKLRENIWSGYVSTRWQASPHWQLDAGLRYEYTQTSIASLEKTLVDRRYGYFFPSISVSRKLGPEKDLSLSYTRRITRPTYNDIAPYVFFWGPRTFSAGNTSLFPSISDAISIGYHYRTWVVTAQFAHSQHEMAMMQPEFDNQTNSLTYRTHNLNYLKTIALNSSYALQLSSWWEIHANVNIQLQIAKTSTPLPEVTRRLYAVNFNITNQIKLPKNFSIEISGQYQSKALSGLSEFLPYGALNAGVQKNIGKKGIIRLSADDILNTNNWMINTSLPGQMDTYFNYKWHNRFVRVTYTKTFGNMNLRSFKVKAGSEEEQRRVGN